MYRSDEPFVLELPPYRLADAAPDRAPRVAGSAALPASRDQVHRRRRRAGLAAHEPAGGACRRAAPTRSPACSGRAFEPLLSPLGIDQQLDGRADLRLRRQGSRDRRVRGDLRSRGPGARRSTSHARIDWVQAYSFMLFTLIYTPCLSTIATLRAESKSSGFALVSVTWSTRARMARELRVLPARAAFRILSGAAPRVALRDPL